jgi:hypothetical protein
MASSRQRHSEGFKEAAIGKTVVSNQKFRPNQN